MSIKYAVDLMHLGLFWRLPNFWENYWHCGFISAKMQGTKIGWEICLPTHRILLVQCQGK